MKFRLFANKVKLVSLLVFICLASCKKDVTVTKSNDSNAATLSDSSTSAEDNYYDVLNNAFVSYSDNTSVLASSAANTGGTTTFSTEVNGSGSHLGCAIYTVDDTVQNHYPKTLTLDFGAGCTSADGIYRKGKLIYVLSGHLFSPGTTVSVSFVQYVVNGYGLQGAYSITNNSTQAGISFTTKVTNGIITYPDATNYHYSHNRTYTMTSGLSTPYDVTDDVYSITGNSSFSDASGSSIVFNVSDPLIKAVSCHNISKGVVSFVYDQVVNGTIDFGDGTCDNLATLTAGNIQKTVILR